MESPGPGRPSRETGLPPGVEVGPLGRRFVAYLVEVLVPAIVGVALAFTLPAASGTMRGVLSIVGALIIVAWAILVIYLQAEKAAGPGMRLMKLQLVGFYDGRPIGWGRVLLRSVLLWLLAVTGVGLVIMLIAMVAHPRRQGWHDRAAKAVVIRERVLAPQGDRSSAAQPASIPYPQPAAPTYGPVAGYSSVPGGQPMPGRAPAPLAPPTGTGYPPAGYPTVGYPPGATPNPPGGGYPQRAPDPYPPVQPTPAPAAPTAAPTVAPNMAPGGAPPPGFVPSGQPNMGSQAQSPMPRSARSAPPAAEAPAPAQDWVAVLDDGRRLIVDRLVLLGRNPRPQPGEEDAQLVKIADETRTVSKVHLAIGLDAAGLYVVDRGSTNGSTVTNPGGASRRCRPGEVIYVNAGSIVSMGDHWLEIRRGDY
jgi:uncharacterized RDD family membrane protein YckC